MFGYGRSPAKVSQALDETTPSTTQEVESQRTLLDVAFPMQKVRIRWHSMDGGEVSVPGQIQTVDGELVEVWFDRNAPSFNPLRSDDQVWIDASYGSETLVFAGWVIGVRPPDTLVILVRGLPRQDQRRQYVRERVDLPPQAAVPLDEDGEDAGALQDVFIIDLSGGGIRMELSQRVPSVSALRLTLDVGSGPFDAVVRVIDVYETLTGRQVVRGYFAEISERFRIAVIRFVFRAQLKKARLSSD